MKVVIVPADNLVMVDGFGSEHVDMKNISESIHAIQWTGASGWIEFMTAEDGTKQPNQLITDISPYQTIIDQCLQHKAEADLAASLPPSIKPPDIESVKKLAQAELLRTDWTQLPDVNLVNKQEFAIYREWCRNMFFNPIDPNDPAFVLMDSPNPVWS